MARMNSKDLDRQIRERIETFLGELSNLVKQSALESVRDALGEGAPARRGPGRPRGRKPGRPARGKRGRKGGGKRIRRSPAQLEALLGRLLAQIRRKPGQGISELAAALRVDGSNLQLPLRKLQAAKKIRTQGRKRSTRYHAR